MQVRLEEFSIHDVCEGLLNMFRPLAEKKNIDLRSQIDAGIPALRQDVTKLQQILQNLLSNAIKFTPEGGRVLLKAIGRWSIRGAHRDRHRRRHRPRGAGAGLREVPPIGQSADARARRHRSGPVDRSRAVQAAGRRGDAAKRAGPGQHVHGPSAAAS